MRKLLVVGALIVGSVLLLQAPAWAPNIYKLRSVTQATNLRKAAPDSTVGTATVKGTSNCDQKAVTITFHWTNPDFIETTSATSAPNGDITVSPGHIPTTHTKVQNYVTAATCAGEPMTLAFPRSLAFSGAATAPLLAFGLSLVVVGTLLVLLSRQRGGARG